MRTRKTNLGLPALALLAAALIPFAPVHAHGAGWTPYTLEILVDGAPLEKHTARGATYVEALEGREYSIRLRNRTGSRVAVALSVDGLNTIDAETTSSREASKWILGPHQTVTLDGWQVSHAKARRFFFTTETESYGAWLGETKNLGVISAAVFRERRPRPDPIYRPHAKGGRSPSAAPHAEGERGADRRSRLDQEAPGETLDDDLAATGIGRKLDHRVRTVTFEAEASPAAVLSIRYEYRDALVRLGVLPEVFAHGEGPLRRREHARGFDDTGFAPDPFRRDR